LPTTLHWDDAQVYEVVNSIEYPDIDDEGQGFIRERIELHATDATLDSRTSYGSTFSISKAATDNAASLKHVISKGQVCIDLEDPEYIIPRTVSFIPEQIFLVLCVVWVDFNNWVSKIIFAIDSPADERSVYYSFSCSCLLQGFVTNLLPYSMQYSTETSEESSVYLSYALQLSSGKLVMATPANFSTLASSNDIIIFQYHWS